MKYFFTADEHYGHERIIQYCLRPFDSVEEMDDEIIKNHNAMVGMEDVVVHAGDFTLLAKKGAESYQRRLNGQHIFIKGSHDYWNKDLPYMWEKKIGDIYVVACHYAMRTWPRSRYKSLLVHGHSHGKLPLFDNSYDVGVDNNSYYPIPLEKIIKKQWINL